MGMDPDQDGAASRFEAVFETYYGDLVRYATRRVGIDAASDVVSSTFLTAWRRIADVPADHARAWLYATARNVIANELRGRGRRERLESRTRSQAPTIVPDLAGPLVDRLRVHAVLETLGPGDQEVLRLIEWERLDIDEAAAALDAHGPRSRSACIVPGDDSPHGWPPRKPVSRPPPTLLAPAGRSSSSKGMQRHERRHRYGHGTVACR